MERQRAAHSRREPGGTGGTREERYGLTRAVRDFRPHVCPDEARELEPFLTG